MSDEEPTECPELIGKVVRSLKIYRHRFDGTEIHIDFADGTSFSCCVANYQKTEASHVICGGPGEPEVLHEYELD